MQKSTLCKMIFGGEQHPEIRGKSRGIRNQRAKVFTHFTLIVQKRGLRDVY
jgi:hypothetical protein